MSAGLRAGYKQTELGVIPEDWDVAALGEVAATSSGTTPARDLVDRYYRNGTVHWVKTLDLNNSELLDTDEQVTEIAVDETSLRPYPIGTVLVAMYGGFNQIGRTGLIRMPAAVNQAITAIQPQATKLHPEYLLATLNFRVGYWETVASSSRKDPNITSHDVRAFPISLPPLPEQRAIASILSDVDALLGGLDLLIAKKQRLKVAAMQQLLTGQTRLPGFSGEWEVRLLGEVADVKTGPFGSSLHESDYVQDGTPIITVEHLGEYGVEHFNLPRVSDSDRRRLQAYSLAVGDIVFSRVGSVDRNALIRRTEEGWLFSGRLLRVRLNQRKVHGPFLSFQFHSEPFKALVRSVAVGQTMASLNTQILKGISVSLPSLPEQAAIATILSDMDTELAALQERRSKTQALKQAMMQELLTGRIRLVPTPT